VCRHVLLSAGVRARGVAQRAMRMRLWACRLACRLVFGRRLRRLRRPGMRCHEMSVPQVHVPCVMSMWALWRLGFRV